MEKIYETGNKIRETEWMSTTIIGKVAKKLKDMGKTIEVNFDKRTPSSFIVDGIEVSLRTSFEGAEVGDYDLGEPTYHVSLGDYLKSPDFEAAVKEVARENNIEIFYSNVLSFNDIECIKPSIKREELRSKLRKISYIDEGEYINILSNISEDINKLINSEKYIIDYNKNGCSLYLEFVSREKTIPEIRKDNEFLHILETIEKYMNENWEKIYSDISKILEKEEKEIKNKKNNQEKEIKNLQDQL